MLLIVHFQKGNDSVILPNLYFGRVGHDQYRCFIFDDRKMYKPKEEVKLKGWIRELTRKGAFSELQLPRESSIKWKLHDSQWVDCAEGETKLNAYGGFDLR